jgi:hypothetical protein
MDEDMDRMLVSVRADTAAFARDVGEMRAALEGPLAIGADRAGRAIETTLARAVRTGKLGFEDLKSVALSAMGEIATHALRSGIGSVIGAGAGAGVGGGGLASVLLAALGAPGRATGGPVSPGRPFWVGERGPELFVPTAKRSMAGPLRGHRALQDIDRPRGLATIERDDAGDVGPGAPPDRCAERRDDPACGGTAGHGERGEPPRDRDCGGWQHRALAACVDPLQRR